MTDNNKKRGSFRKIFPILFFSSKGKQKSIKDTHNSAKVSSNSSTSRDNPYQNPRSMIERYENRNEKSDENDERIYENLSTISNIQNINESNNTSSSSTLVSEKITNRHHQNVDHIIVANKQEQFKYIARPQVPPRPLNEISYSSSVHHTQNNIKSNQYPDVYYHSLEKLEDNISPIDEIEIYKASRVQMQPASVGAEIKKVSTKYLISPKKEAEVRKIQPTRARSLSLDKKPSNIDHTRKESIPYKTVEKPYNYSAPTSPVAVYHKIPNMPATVSPYEHVRKTMIEAEERRNSLSRPSSRNKSTPSPKPLGNTNTLSNDVTTSSFDGDTIKKEKTRKRVEAFYWQKIKEMKLKEDEYLLRQSLTNGMRVPSNNLATYSNSNCSTPISFVTDSRTSSLPRGTEISQPLYPSPFVRGALERRTDSFLNTKVRTEPHIVYRHPEKLQVTTSKINLPIFQRGSLTRENRNILQQQPKRVSFEEQPNFQKTIIFNTNSRNSEPVALVGNKNLRNPPQPPVRTSSAVSANINIRLATNHKSKVVGGSRFFCSESESGSEAGEIQRIMHINGPKGALKPTKKLVL